MEQTIRELCKRVAATGGLDLDNESIIAYQDLIGNATLEENADISNTPELMESFYRIYGAAYGTVAAIKYYMQSSNRILDMQYELGEYKAILEGKEKIIEEERNLKKDYKNRFDEALRDMEGTEKELMSYKAELEAKNKEIIELKAKLYDLTMEVKA